MTPAPRPATGRRTEAATPACSTSWPALQERLYAEGVGGGQRSLLLLLQGMDTSGKDGTVRRVVGAMNPAGVRITSFKKPTGRGAQPRLPWRIDKALPRPGDVGVFNRSQYEDVLVVRVHDLVPEAGVVDALRPHQRVRAPRGRRRHAHRQGDAAHLARTSRSSGSAERLEDPTKYWKYNSGDLTERTLLGRLRRGLPGRAHAVQHRGRALVRRARRTASGTGTGSSRTCSSGRMREMNPTYPPAQFDVAEQRRLVAALEYAVSLSRQAQRAGSRPRCRPGGWCRRGPHGC